MVMNEIGMKFDSSPDKLRWDLLPIAEVEEVVKILTFGAKKYKDNNWKYVPNCEERYYAALLRHIVAYRKGEQLDKETDISHLAHAVCNMLFLMWFDNNKKDVKQV